MPIAGQAVTRFPARNIIAFGFAVTALSYWLTATKLNLGMSFVTASWLRVWQIGSIPLVFIAITTAVYFGLPREKSNQISGLINFVRNIGGSILIALTNAAVTQRSQFHQDQLMKYVTPSGSTYQQMQSMYQGTFTGKMGAANAQHLADGQILNNLQSQSTTLAYIDVFWLLFAACVVMTLLAFLLRRNDPRAGGSQQVAAH